MELAREAGFADGIAEFIGLTTFYAFAKLVREEATAEANAKANASWTLMCEKMVAIERETCARLCDVGVDTKHPAVKGHIMKNFGASSTLAAAIRSRGGQA
jgi:hypothetical protein